MIKLLLKINCAVTLIPEENNGNTYFIYNCKYGRGFGNTIEEVFNKILEKKQEVLHEEKEKLMNKLNQIEEEMQ